LSEVLQLTAVVIASSLAIVEPSQVFEFANWLARFADEISAMVKG